MSVAIGLIIVTLSILLVRFAKSHALAGQPFWKHAADSNWLPILFTALFGFGVVATLGGLLQVFMP
jgi:hypothetical protein